MWMWWHGPFALCHRWSVYMSSSCTYQVSLFFSNKCSPDLRWGKTCVHPRVKYTLNTHFWTCKPCDTLGNEEPGTWLSDMLALIKISNPEGQASCGPGHTWNKAKTSRCWGSPHQRLYWNCKDTKRGNSIIVECLFHLLAAFEILNNHIGRNIW